jgi:hypothetical protein
VPAGHRAHSLEPVGAKCPGGQTTHSCSFDAAGVDDARPAGQARQLALLWPGAGLNVPTGQGRQKSIDEPSGMSLNRPAAHGTQTEDAELDQKPLLHPEQTTLPKPVAWKPAGHAAHDAALSAPALPLKRPDGHATQLRRSSDE